MATEPTITTKQRRNTHHWKAIAAQRLNDINDLQKEVEGLRHQLSLCGGSKDALAEAFQRGFQTAKEMLS